VATELQRWDGGPEEVVNQTTLHALIMLVRVPHDPAALG
jgi:hypothetical protein